MYVQDVVTQNTNNKKESVSHQIYLLSLLLRSKKERKKSHL